MDEDILRVPWNYKHAFFSVNTDDLFGIRISTRKEIAKYVRYNRTLMTIIRYPQLKINNNEYNYTTFGELYVQSINIPN